MEGKEKIHFELWASVATGLEEEAVAEIEASMTPSRGVRSMPGQYHQTHLAEEPAGNGTKTLQLSGWATL